MFKNTYLHLTNNQFFNFCLNKKTSLQEVITNLTDTCIETKYPETFENLGQVIIILKS